MSTEAQHRPRGHPNRPPHTDPRCDTCSAAPGQPCRTEGGDPTERVHLAREPGYTPGQVGRPTTVAARHPVDVRITDGQEAKLIAYLVEDPAAGRSAALRALIDAAPWPESLRQSA